VQSQTHKVVKCNLVDCRYMLPVKTSLN